METYTEQYRRHLTAIDDGIARWVPAPGTRPVRIHEAMHYSLLAGGKRVRPVLVLASADLHGRGADPVPAAVAVECIHTYSLIHDDLPALDNSNTRRGQPSNHIAFDEATAILAGDALLTDAFRILATAYTDTPAISVTLTRLLGDAASSQRLIGGQMEDIAGEGQQLDEEAINFIHANKTAAMIEAALQMGAATTGANDAALAAMGHLGNRIGLAFQIVDDILDATATAEQLGKDTGQDTRNEKNSLVNRIGLDACRERAADLTEEASTLLASFPGDIAFLAEMIRQLEVRIH